MERYEVHVSKVADDDLRDIIRYMTSVLLVPDTAFRLAETIEASIAELGYAPKKFPLVADDRLAFMNYRKKVVKNFIIFYSIDESTKTVDVERILYARRNWSRLL